MGPAMYRASGQKTFADERAVDVVQKLVAHIVVDEAKCKRLDRFLSQGTNLDFIGHDGLIASLWFEWHAGGVMWVGGLWPRSGYGQLTAESSAYLNAWLIRCGVPGVKEAVDKMGNGGTR